MRLKKVFILLLMVSFSVFLFGQSPILESFKVLKNQKKVSVNCIYQDHLGYLWLGTNYGLVKYDGVNFTLFNEKDSLLDLNITALIQDHEHALWIGHESGNITVYSNNKFRAFNPEEGLSKRPISQCYIDTDNRLWFATKGEGLYYYWGKNRKRLYNLNTDDGLLDDYVYDVIQDTSGKLYIATDKGISIYDIELKQFTGKINMNGGLPDNIVKDLEIIDTSDLWIAMEDAGICKYNLKTKQFTTFSAWNFGSLNNIKVLSNNEIWASTKRNGIVKTSIDANNVAWYKQFKKNTGLASLKTNVVFADRENNLWMGTKNGLSIRKNNGIEFFNQHHGLEFTSVFSFTIDNMGNYWIASPEGLYKLSMDEMGNLTQTRLFNTDAFAYHSFISLYKDLRGYIWAGTYGFGVYKINPENLSYTALNTNNGLANNNVIHITGDDEAIWFSTLGGGVSKFCYDNQCFKNFDVNTGLSSNYIYSIFIDNHDCKWIATDGDGIYNICNDTISKITHPLIDSLATISYGFTSDNKNHIWINTAGQGVLKIVNDSTIIHYNELNGLTSNRVQSIINDANGNIILVSNEGMDMLQTQKNTFAYYGEDENVAYTEPNLNAVYKDAQHNVWIGTGKGLIKFLKPDTNVATLPKVQITSKSLFFKKITTNKTLFKYNENHLSFEYIALWFKAPESIVYRYKLNGYDIDWRTETTTRSVTYSNLPYGDYEFVVQAKYQNGIWSDTPHSHYVFKIKPPFWKTLWFLIPMGVMLLFSIYMFVQLRTRKLQKDKDFLEAEVQRRTAEIQKQKEEIEAQRDEIEAQRNYVMEQRDKIEEQNKAITDSIMYASRIQKAILPPIEDFKQLLGDFFVFFKPRDIVSGDFYYLNAKNNQIVVAAADCTGHGVPGAFMSILSVSLLNKIIGEFSEHFDAATILAHLRVEIKKSLRQTTEHFETKDGLDISLCVIDNHKKSLQFAGAYNPLFIVRNGEAIIYKADKMPIGIHLKDNEAFTNNLLELQSNDMLYMYSDGFQDQFGGPDKRKYLAKNMRNFILKNAHQPTKIQRQLLDHEFTRWKGNDNQIDDVLVIGIRV